MDTSKSGFNIGFLANKTNVKVETIRYYEKVGVMPDPPRSPSGYRVYKDAHVQRLYFIRRCRQLGFAMDEIRDLLSLVDLNTYTCSEVSALTLNHASMVKAKIADLRRLEKTLLQIASQCTGVDVPNCPIIDALLDPEESLISRG